MSGYFIWSCKEKTRFTKLAQIFMCRSFSATSSDYHVLRCNSIKRSQAAMNFFQPLSAYACAAIDFAAFISRCINVVRRSITPASHAHTPGPSIPSTPLQKTLLHRFAVQQLSPPNGGSPVFGTESCPYYNYVTTEPFLSKIFQKSFHHPFYDLHVSLEAEGQPEVP